MKKHIYLSVIFFCLFSGVQSQTVTTQYGLVTGHMNGTVYEFLGIPYATPPVDSLRWRAPLPHQNWATTLIADSFPPKCPQIRYEQGDTTRYLEGEEDCLHLNIWSKDLSGTLPVMVFIHGGGNQQGSTSLEQGGTMIYHGKNLCERGDVVMVTIQYRLGPLGYLVHPGLEAENTNGISGNYAVMDQILALTWIKNNIANFGGNPNNITIFGESAGGVNTGNLLICPLAAGLFHKACIQSATPIINDYNDSKTKGMAWVDSFATSGNDVQKIAYMRTLGSDTLLKYASNPMEGGIVQMNWQPVMDQYIFPDFPHNVFQTGIFNHVPLMIGSNSEEMSLSVPQVVTPGMVTLLVNTTVPLAYRPQVLALYPPGSSNTEARQSYIGILSDPQFTVTTRRAAECISKNQAEPVWRYFFTHKHTLAQLTQLGSYHGMELFYVFNNWENASLGQGILFKPADDSTQNIMLKYWTNFARTGDPNDALLPDWPQYDAATDCYLEIKATPLGTQCGLHTSKCDLWDQMTGYIPCSSTDNIAEPIDKESSIKIYPNPALEHITISGLQENFIGIITIYNIIGKMLFAEQKAGSQFSIETQNLNSGIYFIQIRAEEGKMISGKFSKL